MRLDQLTIEEYVYNSSVLAAGLSRNGLDNSIYISLVRDAGKIPSIMEAFEKNNRVAIEKLKLHTSLVHNVLAIRAPAFIGMPLRTFANTQQPYGTFDLIEKLVADLSQYEMIDDSIYLQLLSDKKYIVDSNGMPHIQFWIDDLMTFSSREDHLSIKQEKMAELIRSSFSDDFTPKQLITLSTDIEQGRLVSCLDILNALRQARQNYFDSDSERKGEVIIRSVWSKMQKRMLTIVLILLVVVYALYWFYYSRPSNSTTIYKTKIGDVAFVAEPTTGVKELKSETYVLMFPEEVKEPVIINNNQVGQESSNEAEIIQTEKIETIIIRPGDNLFRISLEHYGSGNYYVELAQYNNIQNPDLIPVGIALEIPPLNELLGNN